MSRFIDDSDFSFQRWLRHMHHICKRGLDGTRARRRLIRIHKTIRPITQWQYRFCYALTYICDLLTLVFATLASQEKPERFEWIELLCWQRQVNEATINAQQFSLILVTRSDTCMNVFVFHSIVIKIQVQKSSAFALWGWTKDLRQQKKLHWFGLWVL